jgi:NADPH2:quinone reductase
MKAMLMTAVGPPEVLRLREIDEPELRSDTLVKVRIRAAGVNPIDTKLRARGLFYPDALPAVLGCDGAGVVTEAGPDVSHLKPGDRVWFCNGGLGGAPGSYAPFAVMEESIARPMPAALDFVEAAAAPLVLITAWEALYDRARMRPDRRVLIQGGAGGVGHVAVQLARLAGGRVCTTVGSLDKVKLVRELGAERPILYREQDVAQAIREWTGGHGVDVALDTVGGETFRDTLALMAHYGDLITLLDPGTGLPWKEARNRNLRIGFELMLTPMLAGLADARRHQGEILDRCGAWFDEARLRIHVSRTLPLEEAAQAHALIEQGHTQGKIVLTLDD